MDTRTLLTRRPIAHRGLHDGNIRRFENSLSAFEEAVAGDYAIELDVHLSADGDVIVFHDETLDRLTAQTGPLAKRMAADLRQTRLGGTADRIPTLAETLERVAGRVPVVIEMKGSGARKPELAQAVAKDLAGYGGPVAVMSFDHELIAAFRATGSPVPCGLTAEGIGENALARHRKALALGIDFVSYHVAALPNAFVTHVRDERGLPVITWTVRTPEDVETTYRHADQMTFEGFEPD